MIVKQLEWLLSTEATKIDFSYRSDADIAERFRALRGCGRLPRGRDKHVQALSSEQIAYGILTLVPQKPGYAGMAAICLSRLRPVGGVKASFAGAETLNEALSAILEQPHACNSVLEVRVSGSEFYTNSNGRAAIYYESDNVIKTAYYEQESRSFQIEGAELTYNPRSSLSAMIHEVVFYRWFFDKIVGEMSIQYQDGHFDFLIDPDEEEMERKKQERIERLKINANSGFLSLPVDTHVTWPKEETVVEFEGKRLVLMPRTRESDTSIHMDIGGQGLSLLEGETLINRFLSLLCWCDDQFCVVQDGIHGSRRFPVAVLKRNLAFSTTPYWVFDRKIPESSEARTALALYRQGRNAEQNYSVSYAVLSYYKVIETKHKKEPKKWFEKNYPKFRKNKNGVASWERFEKECGDEKPHEYIHDMCRVAVAHVSEKHLSDPDNVEELRRLHIAADVMRGLARYFIQNELQVSVSHYDGT